MGPIMDSIAGALAALGEPLFARATARLLARRGTRAGARVRSRAAAHAQPSCATTGVWSDGCSHVRGTRSTVQLVQVSASAGDSRM